jgi:bifunctional UDP-N-acetylglucosamine pyrophosphorylase/glucosamine-1-phosphate N-acetyltransferase
LPHIDPERQVIVLSGDVPLIQSETIMKMSEGAPELRVLTMHMEDPTGYGRIITRRCINDSDINDVPQFVKIVEHKDCTEEERACTTVNCGIYAFSGKVAHRFVPLIQNINAQGEYYLTDIVGLAHGAGIRVEVCHINDDERHTVRGVNNLAELAEIERHL